MSDIYDIKGILLSFPFSFFDTILFLVIIFFIIIFYFYFYKNKGEIIIENKKENIKKSINYKKILENIDKNISSKEFLQKISKIFRLYLENEKNYKNFSKMTLKDILKKKSIKNEYKKFLKDIYFKEYREEEINLEEKERLLFYLKNIVEKNIKFDN